MGHAFAQNGRRPRSAAVKVPSSNTSSAPPTGTPWPTQVMRAGLSSLRSRSVGQCAVVSPSRMQALQHGRALPCWPLTTPFHLWSNHEQAAEPVGSEARCINLAPHPPPTSQETGPAAAPGRHAKGPAQASPRHPARWRSRGRQAPVPDSGCPWRRGNHARFPVARPRVPPPPTVPLSLSVGPQWRNRANFGLVSTSAISHRPLPTRR